MPASITSRTEELRARGVEIVAGSLTDLAVLTTDVRYGVAW
ncbi:hypothetical protein P3H80_06285 [Mycolicibacterium septicum]|nr:hypothetical protein [Mycolicibacterium septicum]MDF3337017.1 hypothetical protein [Mycolicibacterium septicum]